MKVTLEQLEQARPQVIALAIQFKPAQMEPEDAAGIGVEALMKSIEKFDPDRGANLVTYSKFLVRSAMVKARRQAVNQVETVSLEIPMHDGTSIERDVAAPEPPEDVNDDVLLAALQLVDNLPEFERLAVRFRLGVQGVRRAHTFPEIGKCLGVSKQRAEQIFQAGVTRLRKQLTELIATGKIIA